MSAKARINRLEKKNALLRNGCLYPPHGIVSESLEETEEFVKATIAGGDVFKKYLASRPKSEECRCTRCTEGERATQEWIDELLGRKDEHQITTQ